MRVTRLLGVFVALAAGLSILFLAHDVTSWHHTLRSEALRSLDSPAMPSDSAMTILPSTVSGSLLGVSRQRDWLKARRAFTLANNGTIKKLSLNQDDYRLLNGAEATLGRLTQDPNPVRASRAYNLLAALVFREAYPGTVVVRRLIQEALTDEQNAVRLDNTDEAAKENLELTLRVLIAVGLPPQQARAAGTRRASAKKGGFQGPPGAGY